MVKRLIHNLKLRFYKWRMRKQLQRHHVEIEEDQMIVNDHVVKFPDDLTLKEELRLVDRVDALRDTGRFRDPYEH